MNTIVTNMLSNLSSEELLQIRELATSILQRRSAGWAGVAAEVVADGKPDLPDKLAPKLPDKMSDPKLPDKLAPKLPDKILPSKILDPKLIDKMTPPKLLDKVPWPSKLLDKITLP